MSAEAEYLLNAMSRIEAGIGRIYLFFAALFPEDKEFYTRLCHEEAGEI
jgi:hypothetical protein